MTLTSVAAPAEQTRARYPDHEGFVERNGVRTFYEVYGDGGARPTGHEPVLFARQMQDLGAGEILLTAIDRDGTMKGYDIELIARVTSTLSIPVIACGGAGAIADFGQAAEQGGAAAVAAGAMFVFHGRHRAVLITYPSQAELAAVLN